MTWTHTSRGRALDLLDPQPDDVDIEEIARALGYQCRYNGCTTRFYSVAEHSVLIARWLRSEGHPVAVQLAGLLHDAAEAYTGDITYPMQEVLFTGGPGREAGPLVRKRYKAVQAGLDSVICSLVDLDPALLHSDPVKWADLRILLDERDAVLTGRPRPWAIEEQGAQPLGVQIECWHAEVAGFRWLHELRRLVAERVAP